MNQLVRESFCGAEASRDWPVKKDTNSIVRVESRYRETGELNVTLAQPSRYGFTYPRMDNGSVEPNRARIPVFFICSR